MSDGPFKNFRLGRHWKRFAAAAHNDAVDPAERGALACDALTNDLLTDENRALQSDLHALVRRPQLEFDPTHSVDITFRSHSKTAFGDTLQRELAPRVSDQMPLEKALACALRAAVHGHATRARSRIEEECLHSRESREMTQDQCDRTVIRVNETFDALSESDICDAVRAGHKNAFQRAVSKKTGLDDGPSL